MVDQTSASVVIVNPRAAAGRVGRSWTELQPQLEQRLGETQFLITGHPGHAIDLADQAVRDGVRRIWSLGGDGTHSEVVNGIMRAKPPPGEVTLGLLPAGTGGDFSRMVRHRTPLDSAEHASWNTASPVDVGLVQATQDDGEPVERYFLNIASCGISGLIVRIVDRSSKRLGGRISFFAGTLKGLMRYRLVPVRIIPEEGEPVECPIYIVAVCNGQFFGGGMKIGPQAKLADGLLDVVIMTRGNPLQVMQVMRGIYSGDHLRSPVTRVMRVRSVRVEPLQNTTDLEIDGESIGQLPAEFSILPGAIRLVEPRPEVL